MARSALQARPTLYRGIQMRSHVEGSASTRIYAEVKPVVEDFDGIAERSTVRGG